MTRSIRLLVAATAVLVAVAGCGTRGAGPEGGPQGGPQGGTGDGAGTSAGTLPSGVSVALDQWRADEGPHMIEIAVTNTGPAPVYFERVQLLAPPFATLPAAEVATEVRPGPRVDLRIPYGAARCPADRLPAPEPATVIARLRDTAGGPARTVGVPLAHPHPLLAKLLRRECGAHLLRASVDIGFGTAWRETRGQSGPVLHGTLVLERKAGDQPVRLTEIAGSVMLNLLPEGPRRTPLAALAGAARRVELPVRVDANRCDPHALMESKRTFFFSVWAVLGDLDEQSLDLLPDPATQARFQDVLDRSCTFD